MAKTKLQVVNAPSYIYVGETLGLNVQTDATSWDVSMNPVGIVNFNAARDKMTGLSKGSVQITIKAQREGYESNSVMIDLRVLEKESQSTSIMFHNRKTNRVSKLITPLTANTDIVVKMPESSSGTLVTSDNLTSTFATIVKPVIIDPKTGDVDCEGQLTATDYQTQLGYQGAHEGSIWEYATDKDFENILDTRTIIRGDKTKGPIFHTGATIWVRVKYVSYQVESEWSDPVQFTCKNYGRDSLQTTPNNGNWIDGTYFGIVPHSELIDNRDYRGHWKTLNTYNLKTFTSGMQVHQDETDTLYYALKDIAAADNIDPIISVANSDGKWAIDTRENLPTPRWVNEITGIGMGYTDNNGDGYSSGATAVGAMVDHTLGWIKYVYKGRLCYTTKKPICTQLCWNDIGKRDIMYGERTFRGGATQMYRIRLMREDEYVAIMGGLMDGTLGAFSKVDLGLVDATDQSIGRLQWLEDFQEGAKRKVGSPDMKIFETDPKTRVGILPLDTGYTKWLMSYRPVIELVTESDEPWKNWPLGPEADNENFRYDKYTDTGYFGQVRSDMFIDGDSLAAQIGLTAGTSINSNCGWFKFWWHGMMLYISVVANRSYMQWNYIKAIHRINHFDTGNYSSPDLDISGQTWKCGVMNIMTYSPHGGNAGNTSRGSGVHAWWVDLFFRVFVGTDKPYFNTMGTLSNSGNAGVKYFTINHGYQIGDNWEENNFLSTCQTHNEESTINIWNVPDALNAAIYFPSRISGDMSTCLGMYYGSSNAVDGNDMWRPVLVPTSKPYLSVELNTTHSDLITKLLNRKAVLLSNLEQVYTAIETFTARIKAVNPTTMYIAQRYIHNNVNCEEIGYESSCSFTYYNCRNGGGKIYSKDNTVSATVYITSNWVPVRNSGWWSGNAGPRWWINICLVEEAGILYFGSYGKLYNTKDNYDVNNGGFLGRGWQNPARYKLPTSGTLDWTDRNVVWGPITTGTMNTYLTQLYNVSDKHGNPTEIQKEINKVNEEINKYYGK